MNFNKVKENGTDHGKATPIAMVAPEVKQSSDDTEITKTCAVLGCDDYKSLESHNFFGFPEEESLRQIWADLTGRHDWTPTDYSYICINHFSMDSFDCNEQGNLILVSKAIPSAKLPGHVLEGEYIDEETLENDVLENGEDYEMDSEYEELEEDELDEPPPVKRNEPQASNKQLDNVELLKLFTEVQQLQRQTVGVKEKLRGNMKLHNQQAKYLERLKHAIEVKQKLINQKKKKKSRILLSIQDKIKEDSNGLVLAMPLRHSNDLKNFALSIYKYSPQAYIYARNTLRTMLPSTDVLESWLKSGYHPKNIMTNNNLVKVTAEQTETELSCKVTIN